MLGENKYHSSAIEVIAGILLLIMLPMDRLFHIFSISEVWYGILFAVAGSPTIKSIIQKDFK